MFIRYICKDSRHGSQQICVVHFGAEPSHQTHLPLATPTSHSITYYQT
jgi:hypothetical protein